MKEELKKIIQELKEVTKDEKLNVLDKDLLEFSIRIMNTNVITINKPKFDNKLKNELSPKERLEPKDNEGPATKNQIYFLKKNNITIPEGLTKKEAFNLIKEIKK